MTMAEFDPNKPFKKLPDPEPEFDPSKPFKSLDEGPSTLERVGEALNKIIVEPAKKAAGTILAPAAKAGEVMDRMTGAPLRAGVGALQRGEGLGGAGSAFVDQAAAGFDWELKDGEMPTLGHVLPTTPTGEQIAERGALQAGIAPEYAKTIAGPGGLAADAALDATNIIPAGPLAKGAGKLRRGALNLINKGEHFAAAGGKVLGVPVPGVMSVGRFMTAGTLNYQKAVKAVKQLNTLELWAPGNPQFGAMSKAMADVGEMRRALREKKITVPGSRDVALDVMRQIQEAAGRSISHPHAEELIKKIDSYTWEPTVRVQEVPIPDEEIAARVAEIEGELARVHGLLDGTNPAEIAESGRPMQAEELVKSKTEAIALGQELGQYKAYLWQRQNPNAAPHVKPFTRTVEEPIMEQRELTLDELDDITGMLDELIYTGQGNERNLRRVYGPAVKASRAALDDVMQTVPEGTMFKAKKSHQEALMTASKGRSKLIETFAYATAPTIGLITLDPASLLALSILPQSYMRVMGVLKIPGGIARTMLLARQTGKAAKIREALESIAGSHPAIAERLVRGTLLAASKPDGSITEEEAATLGRTRIFDPEQVMAEKLRLQADKDMPTGEKARKLSDIHRNGYVTMDGPAPEPEPEIEPGNPILGGQKGLQDLLRSLGG